MKCYSLRTLVSSCSSKLHWSSMFAWQSHSKDQRDVRPFTDFLEFIDLLTRAWENTTQETDWKCDSDKKSAVNSYMVDVQDSCVACKGKHQLHMCRDFRCKSRNRKMAIVKKNALCMNCFRPGHFLKNCPTKQRCKGISKGSSFVDIHRIPEV